MLFQIFQAVQDAFDTRDDLDRAAIDRLVYARHVIFTDKAIEDGVFTALMTLSGAGFIMVGKIDEKTAFYDRTVWENYRLDRPYGAGTCFVPTLPKILDDVTTARENKAKGHAAGAFIPA